MKLVDKIKALFNRKPKVVEKKPPDATEEKKERKGVKNVKD